jgi:murein DD-endopeptidase MepM/ murein hydrolase activator NlpD
VRRGWARFPSFASAFLLGSIGATLAAPWPLRDRQTVTTSVDGEVLATFEFKTEGGANYMHEGIDIAAVPKSKDPNAPVVIAVVDGTVVDVKNVANSYDNYVKVEGTDGNCYLYLHLDGITVGTGASVSAGKPLGDVFAWPWCTTNYDHLHLEISKPGDACVPDSGVFTSALIAPLTQLESVANDDSPPVVEDIAVCTDGGDCDGLGVAGCDPTPATCLDVTKGRLDIVAEIQDLYGTRFVRTAGDPIAPETIEWRACSEAAPDCDPWNPFLDLKTMDPLWIDRSLQKAVGPLFDNLGSCVSSGAYCADSQSCPPAADFCSKTGERFRYIVTNVDGSGKPSSSGSWDTSTLASGHYTVAVAAVDYEGNRGARSVPVCLHDPESCLAKLTVRDCEGDNGAEPSACDLGWLSPDIIENPDAAGNPGSAVVAGSANTVRVCATNTGCAPIPGDDHVSFALDWAITTASVPYPVGTIGGVAVPDTPGLTVKDLTKRDGSAPASTDWPVGEERCTDLKWTPSAGGHVCLVVRVAHGSDAPTPGPAAALDNNRAQHNLVLTDAVAVSPTTWLSLVAIHLGPLPPKRAR